MIFTQILMFWVARFKVTSVSFTPDFLKSDSFQHMDIIICFFLVRSKQVLVLLYWNRKLHLFRVISHHRVRLATPLRTVQKIYRDADLDNVPFADSIFSRSRAKNRPYVLIEPSYKINYDKYKGSIRFVHTNEDTKGDTKAVSMSSGYFKTDDRVAASDSQLQNFGIWGLSRKIESAGHAGKVKVGVDQKD